MTIVGITGPTGAGKTTALALLRRRGYTVVDCDELYHRQLRHDGQLRAALEEQFGRVFLPDGGLDRALLAGRVFGSPKELEKLNAIIYPSVCGAVKKIMESCTGVGVAIDAINLVESGLDKLCDFTVAVTAPVEVRLERIMARDGLTREQAQARINAQKPDKFYRKNCTFLLENQAGSRAAFEELMDDFFSTILFDAEE